MPQKSVGTYAETKQVTGEKKKYLLQKASPIEIKQTVLKIDRGLKIHKGGRSAVVCPVVWKGKT